MDTPRDLSRSSRASIRQSILQRRMTRLESSRVSLVEPSLLDKRLCEVFDVFDTTRSDEIDVGDLGTVIRALGCVVTEAELQEIQVQVEDVLNNTVPLHKFLEYMSKAINEGRFKPAEPEDLLQAFQLLDPDNKGYIICDELEKTMMEVGEPFSKQEIDNMMSIACDPETKRINYEHYINLLLVKIPEDLNLYRIVEVMEQAKLEAMPRKRRLESLLMDYTV